MWNRPMSERPRRRGLLIILSSPSGAGKSTLSRRLLEFDPEVRFSISATTRPPRPGEQEGRDYFFKSRREFEAMVEAGEMLEHAEVFGNLYGTPRAPVEAAIGARARTCSSTSTGRAASRSATRPARRGGLDLHPAAVDRRAGEAGCAPAARTRAEVVAERMAKSRDEISHWAEYDYVLINENLPQCEAELRAIIAAERLRRDRRPELVGLVRRLNAEFEERLT